MKPRHINFLIHVISGERDILLDSCCIAGTKDPKTITEVSAIRDLHKFDKALRILRREKESK